MFFSAFLKNYHSALLRQFSCLPFQSSIRWKNSSKDEKNSPNLSYILSHNHQSPWTLEHTHSVNPKSTKCSRSRWMNLREQHPTSHCAHRFINILSISLRPVWLKPQNGFGKENFGKHKLAYFPESILLKYFVI